MSTALPEQFRSRKPYQCLLSGIDSLYVSFYLDGIGFDWEELAFQQELAKQDRSRCTKITLGGRDWALSPGGKYPYRFVLRDAHCEVRLAEKMQPNCHVQFTSFGLWSVGLPTLMERLRGWFVAMGTRETHPEQVSRADFAFDFHLPVIDFSTENFVTRLNKDSTWREHGTYQTFHFGQGDVVVRVYDKVAEITQASGKSWFFNLWGQKEGVWRVEFQVRGEYLKQYGIRTLGQLESQRSRLLVELSAKHTTLRRRGRDSNRSRWPLHPLWTAVQAAASSEIEASPASAINPETSLSYSLHHMTRAIYGHFKGFAALVSIYDGAVEPATFEEAMARLTAQMKRLHHPNLWDGDIRNRMEARRLGQ